MAHSPPLVEVNQKHHVVPEAGQPVGRGHGDDEGEDVVDEGVESLRSGTGERLMQAGLESHHPLCPPVRALTAPSEAETSERKAAAHSPEPMRPTPHLEPKTAATRAYPLGPAPPGTCGLVTQLHPPCSRSSRSSHRLPRRLQATSTCSDNAAETEHGLSLSKAPFPGQREPRSSVIGGSQWRLLDIVHGQDSSQVPGAGGPCPHTLWCRRGTCLVGEGLPGKMRHRLHLQQRRPRSVGAGADSPVSRRGQALPCSSQRAGAA